MARAGDAEKLVTLLPVIDLEELSVSIAVLVEVVHGDRIQLGLELLGLHFGRLHRLLQLPLGLRVLCPLLLGRQPILEDDQLAWMLVMSAVYLQS